MNNGYDAVRRALTLMGYDPADSGGQPWSRLWDKAPTALQMVYADLHGVEQRCLPTPPESLSEPLLLSARAMEALPLGVAMVLSQMIGDEDAYVRFFGAYTESRAGLSTFTSRQDVLPVTAGG